MSENRIRDELEKLPPEQQEAFARNVREACRRQKQQDYARKVLRNRGRLSAPDLPEAVRRELGECPA